MSSYTTSSSQDQSVIIRTATVPVPTGSRVARTPLGNFFYGKPDPLQTKCEVTLNGIPQTYGPDFGWYYNGCTNPPAGQPPSVRDVASGVLFNDPMPAPSTVVLTWKQRILNLPCDQVMIVRTDWDETIGKFRLWELPDPNAAAPNGTTYVIPSSDPFFPNSFLLPEQRSGVVIEVWRLSRTISGRVWKSDGSGGYDPYDKHGPRYLPYYRGPHPDCNNPNILPVHRILQGTQPLPNAPGPFTQAPGWRYWGGPFPGNVVPGPGEQAGASGNAGERRLALKLCWYDTTTGARGPLSPFNMIYSGSRSLGDRHPGSPFFRRAGCLWLQTQ